LRIVANRRADYDRAIVFFCARIGTTATRHIYHLFEKTPWLYWPTISGLQPVRHNLNPSFLDQLDQDGGDEVVEELGGLSPSPDEKPIALALAMAWVRLLTPNLRNIVRLCALTVLGER
jgi:hypothetical protein